MQESMGSLKRSQIVRLPNYLIFHIKRFTKNNWAEEKNPTIVNFPIKNLDMRDCNDFFSFFSFDRDYYFFFPFFFKLSLMLLLRLDLVNPDEENLSTHYDLIANICHEGRPGKGKGIYKG